MWVDCVRCVIWPEEEEMEGLSRIQAWRSPSVRTVEGALPMGVRLGLRWVG